MNIIGDLSPAARAGEVGRVQAGVAVGSPFCDYLNVSFPRDDSAGVESGLSAWLDGYGFVRSSDGLYQAMEIVGVRGKAELRCVGTIKQRCGAQWVGWSASGGALSHLRRQGVYEEYLGLLGGFPHRVTMLHASCDYVDEGPVVVRGLLDRALMGKVRLTRKWVDPKNVKSILSVDSFGSLTGTAYLGQRRNADVWAKVYDKRHERVTRGFADPGPLVRVEVACMSDVGVTLRDAASPDGVFYEFAGPSLVEVPAGAGAWVRGGEGFVCSRVEIPVFKRVDRLLEGCKGLRQAALLARGAYGGDWRKVFLQQVARQLDQVERGLSLSDRGEHVR